MIDRSGRTPEGELIYRLRKANRPGAGVRAIAPEADLSEGRWRQIESGYQSVGGQKIAVSAPAATLARMAAAVGGTPADLVNVGRADAAAELRKLPDPPRSEAERLILGAPISSRAKKLVLQRYRRRLEEGNRAALEYVREQLDLLRSEETG
jgi:hypothetical protein